MGIETIQEDFSSKGVKFQQDFDSQMKFEYQLVQIKSSCSYSHKISYNSDPKIQRSYETKTEDFIPKGVEFQQVSDFQIKSEYQILEITKCFQIETVK